MSDNFLSASTRKRKKKQADYQNNLLICQTTSFCFSSENQNKKSILILDHIFSFLHDGDWTTNTRFISSSKWTNISKNCFMCIIQCWFNHRFSFFFITFHWIFIFSHSFKWNSSTIIHRTSTTIITISTTNYHSYN